MAVTPNEFDKFDRTECASQPSRADLEAEQEAKADRKAKRVMSDRKKQARELDNEISLYLKAN
jgi:hypothetical protein